MSKRQKFVLASILLSVGLLSTQLIPVTSIFRYLSIVGLFVVSYFVSAWALFDDLKGIEWLVIVPLPGMYAASVSLFYFLLPEALISKIIIFGLFSLGSYAMFLTCNIYSVAAIRTIQLLRAAHAVGFLMTLITALFFYNSIFSFQMPFFLNGLLVFVVSLPLVLTNLWTVKLEPFLSRSVITYAVVITFILMELATALSFWPATVWINSLFLVTALYVFLGLMQHHLQDRLFKKTFQEFVLIGMGVVVLMMLLTRWR